jgi:hypothetical protein
MAVQAQGRCESTDHWRAQRLAHRTIDAVVSVSALTGIGFGGWVLVTKGTGSDLLGLGIIVLMTYWVMSLVMAYLQSRSCPGHYATVELQFTEDQLLISAPNHRAELQWPAISRWKENHHLFLLFLAPTRYFFVPKRYFSSQGDIEAVRRMLTERIPPSKR